MLNSYPTRSTSTEIESRLAVERYNIVKHIYQTELERISLHLIDKTGVWLNMSWVTFPLLIVTLSPEFDVKGK